MSDSTTPTPTPTVTAMPRVWKTLLVASLALNLLIGGAVATRVVTHGPPERFMGASYAQLVPRRFLADLDKERRGELLKMLRTYRPDFHNGKMAARLASVKLADALLTDPYDVAAVTAAIDEYAAAGHTLVGRGGDAAKEFIARLTPEERRKMAARLRQRAGVADRDDDSGQGPGGR